MASYGFEFYSTGTISVTAGQTAFTGTGTAWQLRGCEGALLVIAGANAVDFVASLSSDNAGQLRMPWAGATLTDAQYVMWLPSASAATNLANHQRLAEIIASINEAQPASDQLSAFAALKGAAGGIPVFTGTDTIELMDDSRKNLAELTALAKKNDQFIVMGPDGKLELKSIKEITDAIGEKLDKPKDGTVDQLIDATGVAITKSGLPISMSVQNALNGKADAAATQSALSSKASLSGATFTGLVSMQGSVPTIDLVSGNGVNRWRVIGNITDTVDYGIVFQNSRTGVNLVEIGASGRALITYGDVYINGSISKGGGTFLIDHPLDPANRNLRHGFVEAPRYELIYRGSIKLVNGRASVNIDSASDMTSGTFTALTKNACVTSLQNQDGFTRLHPSPIVQGAFEIICDDETCTDTVSWVVIAERNDAYVRYIDPNCERGTGRFIPEFDKED